MKKGEIYFYDHPVSKRIMICLEEEEFYDIGRMKVSCKSIYAKYSAVGPKILGVWNDDC